MAIDPYLKYLESLKRDPRTYAKGLFNVNPLDFSGSGNGMDVTPLIVDVPPAPTRPTNLGAASVSPDVTPVEIPGLKYTPIEVKPADYQYVAPRAVPPVDMGKFPMPPAPTYQTMPQMPERQFGMEQRGERQASLRAGLIGLLLGGPAGALAGAGGAQQAYRTATQQQYDQALREYQAKAQQAEFANALEAQKYREALAARQTGVSEAMSLYEMDRRAAEAEATSKNAQNELNRALSTARTTGNKDAYTYWSGVQDDMMKVDPAYQQRFLQWVINGRNPAQIPPGGWPAVQKDVSVQRFNALTKIRTEQSKLLEGLPPDRYRAGAQAYNSSIMSDPNLTDAEKKYLMLPSEISTMAKARVEVTKRGQDISAQQKEADRALRESIANDMVSIRREANAIASRGVQVRAEAERAKREGKTYQVPRDLVSSVMRNVARYAGVINKLQAELNKPIYRGSFGNNLRAQLSEARAAYKEYTQTGGRSELFDFGGIDSGTPVATVRQLPTAPKGPNPPSPKAGGSPGAETNVGGVRIRVNVR